VSEHNDYAAQSWDLTPVSEEEKTFHLLLPKGAQVRSAQLEVRGAPLVFWEDLMSPNYGATVTPGQENDEGAWADLAQESLVVDFHALRATNRLRIEATWPSSGNRYCRLQPWAGITWHQPEPVASYVLPPNGTGIPLGAVTEADFPELEVQKMMLSFHDDNDPPENDDWTMQAVALSQLELFCRSTPSNLSLRVGDGPPFWTHRGPLSKALGTPDFAEALNEYLAGDALPKGEPEHSVPLTIRSDTLGEVEISLATLDHFFVVDRFVGDATEKTLTFACQGPWTQIAEFELPAEAEVQSATVHLAGLFADDRFVDGYGPMDTADEEFATMVSPDHWAAQEIVPAESVTLSGVDLYLTRISERVELIVEIQSDVKQAPSGVASATVQLSLQPDNDGPRWHCLDLPSPAELEADKRYWLVLKAEEGQVNWQAQSGKTPLRTLSYSQDEGTSWTGHDLALWGQSVKIAGRFRLRHLPATYSPPIGMSIELTDIDLSGLTSSEEMVFNADFTEHLTIPGKVPLGITAHTMGQLTLSSLRIEYKLPVEPSEESEEEEPSEEETPKEESQWGLLAEQDVQIIHGVGSRYAEELKKVGIETLSQLAELDPFTVAINIPQVRLFEFQRKAEVAIRVKISAGTFAPLLDLYVSDILKTPRSSFAELDEKAPQAWAQLDALMKDLRTLQVVLDDDFLAECRLGDLMGG
jgi:hypothetical protein